MKPIKTCNVTFRRLNEVPANCIVNPEALEAKGGVVEIYDVLADNEGVVVLPWETKTVKVTKVIAALKVPGEIGDIKVITDNGALIVGVDGEDRVDEINDVIKSKGYAEMAFAFNNVENKGLVQNIGILGNIRNA
jgi:hypothetical protein